jgi:hypothetical protein
LTKATRRHVLLAGVMSVGMGLLVASPASAAQPAGQAGGAPYVKAGRTVATYSYADAIRESVWVQTPLDNDSDGRPDQVVERWARTARTECLDWVLVRSQRHLHRVLSAYVTHYNTAPHRGNHLDVPAQPAQPAPARHGPLGPVERIDILGALIHEYRHAA